MATYTAFLGALRPGTPNFDGQHYYYPVYADMVILNAQNQPQSVNDSGNDWQCHVEVFSDDPIVVTDTLVTLRAKVMSVVRRQFPQIKATDTVKAVWLDDGGLLSL